MSALSIPFEKGFSIWLSSRDHRGASFLVLSLVCVVLASLILAMKTASPDRFAKAFSIVGPAPPGRESWFFMENRV
jgi:drug/metabolite transporter superfamily protein YnfA